MTTRPDLACRAAFRAACLAACLAAAVLLPAASAQHRAARLFIKRLHDRTRVFTGRGVG
jgi:hypothetical protein